MICCIIGKGSIGIRHSKILKDFKVKIFFIRRKPNNHKNDEITFKSKFLNKVKFFIISNPSSLHLSTIRKILSYNKPIFVEKPFVTQKKINSKIKNYNKLFVLYQMRFDPRIDFIKKKIIRDNIQKAKFTWKTFLPNWHKNEDYKKSYAARKKLGGGVIFTMSHEIDLAIYLLGPVKQVLVKKNKNKLKIDVEDNVKINIKHKGGYSSNIILNFASTKNLRKFKINSKNNYYSWNFFHNKVNLNHKSYNFKLDNDNIYKIQIKHILSIIKKEKYEKSRIHINNTLHTQEVIAACVESLLKKKKIILN